MELDFVQTIDLSKVERDDRTYIRTILLGLLQFHHPMPKVDVDVFDAPDHYNISIKGWTQAIDFAAWYNAFLNPETRDGKYDIIVSSAVYPVGENGSEGKVVVRVRRSKYQDHKKRK